MLRAHNIPEAFPQMVLDEAERMPETVESSQLIGREDLRGERVYLL